MQKATPEQILIYRRMTPDQKWQAALRLSSSARELKAAAVRSSHPEWTEDQVQAAVRRSFLYTPT